MPKEKINALVTISTSSVCNNFSEIYQKSQEASSHQLRFEQLELWELIQKKPEGFALQKCSKPQISSTPGIPPKEKHRYRVSLGNRILGDRLTLDEALALAKRGKR